MPTDLPTRTEQHANCGSRPTCTTEQDSALFELFRPGFPWIFTRYVAFEIFQGLVFGGSIILAVWFSTDNFQDILNLMPSLGISVSQCVTLVILGIPRVIADNLPVAIFVGAFLILRRMRDDNEILALQINGIALSRLLVFPLVIGIFSALIHFAFLESIEPMAVKKFREQLTLALYRSKTPAGLSRSSVVEQKLGEDGKNVFILVRDDSQQLKEAFVLSFDKNKNVRLITSESVRTTDRKWEFRNGHLYEFAQKLDGFRSADFERMTMPGNSKLQELFAPISSQPRYMSTTALNDATNHLEDPEKLRYCHYYLARKFCEPLSCIFFIIALLPLAAQSGRRGQIIYDGIYIAVFVIGFYLVRSSAEAAGLRGLIDPFLAAFTPLIFILAASFLSNRLQSILSSGFAYIRHQTAKFSTKRESEPNQA